MKKTTFLAIASALCALTACTGKKADQNTEKEKPIVRIQTVTTQAVPQLSEFTATIEPNVKNNISSNAPLRIKAIYVEVGTRVSKGQRLVTMDAVNLDQIRVQQADLQKNYNRMNELFQVGAISQQQLDQVQSQLDIANASLRNVVENTTLVSPISGVVTARNYDAGDMANGPILTVMQIQPVKVVINVSESFFSQLKTGMEVSVKIDAFGDEKFKGKVSLIYPTLNEGTRTFPVEIEIPNSDSRIRPGMFARVTVDFGTLNHVVVPDRAVVKQPGSGEYFVYVYNKDGKVSHRKIQIGQRLNTEYELLSGVENGAQVVTAGQARLSDGIEVQLEQKQ